MCDLKSSTKNAYSLRVVTLSKKLGFSSVPDCPISSWVDLEKLDEILSKYKKDTSKALLNALIHYLDKDKEKEFYDKLVLRRENLKDKIREQNELNMGVKSERDEKYWVTVEELLDKYKIHSDLFNNSPNLDSFIILFYLFPFHNPDFVDPDYGCFRNDLATLRYGDFDNENCYNGEVIKLYDHKNSKKKGAMIIKVPQELNDIFSHWGATNQIQLGELIIKANKLKINRVLTKHLGTNSTTLRKIKESRSTGAISKYKEIQKEVFESEEFKRFQQARDEFEKSEIYKKYMEAEELAREEAKRQNHTLETSLLYYHKN